MQMTIRTKYAVIALGLMAAATVVSCGRNSGGSDSSKSKPASVQTLLQAENKVGNDKVVLNFGSNVDNASYQCQVEVINAGEQAANKGAWSMCVASGLEVPIPEASLVTVSVKAIDANGNEDSSPLVLQYKGAEKSAPIVQPTVQNPAPQLPETQVPGNGQGGQYGYPDAQHWSPFELTSLNLSSSWSFRVPRGMHVLQYSADYGVGTGIDVVQIMMGQDPNYFGLYPGSFRTDNGCSRLANRPIGIRSPAGDVLGYCAGKVYGKAQVNKMFGAEYAVNHIEVGSDIDAPIKKRMLVQVYRNYNRNRSILSSLCSDRANVSGYNEVFANIPVMENFWAYDYLVDNVRTCRVTLNGLNGGRWQVAGFIFTQADYARSSRCASAHRSCQASDMALEVVYLEKNEQGMTRYSDYFVRDFQELIFDTLGRENPYMPF
ncbi:MAG: hypothetical protein R3B45_11220 [Bdellovibrionota bacterium]